MTTRPLRLGIIGAGAVSELYHLPASERCAEVAVTAIADTDLSRARALGRRFKIPYARARYEDLFGRVDAALVAVPNHLHAPVALDFLRRGVPVLLEKPVCLNVAEADEVIRASEGAGIPLAVGLVGRNWWGARQVKRLIDEGALGTPQEFFLELGRACAWNHASGYLFDRSRAGGGVLLDLGSHALDLLLWWLGELSCQEYQDDSLGGLEAECSLSLASPRGALKGRVTLSRLRSLGNFARIVGDRGGVEWSLSNAADVRVWPVPRGDGQAGERALTPPEGQSDLEPYVEQLRRFARAVRGEAPPLVSAREARASLALIAECYRLRSPSAWASWEPVASAVALIKDWSQAVRLARLPLRIQRDGPPEAGRLRRSLKRSVSAAALARDWLKARLMPPKEPLLDDEALFCLKEALRGSENAVERFTREFCSYLGVRYGVAVNSGTSALELAVASLQLDAGDEVIVPSYTFYSTASAVVKAGARPVFVDVRLTDGCIDPRGVSRAVTRRTRAVIAVHLGGTPADLDALQGICRESGLILIEDVAQAVGSEWRGRRLGSFGDLAAFSFQASKNLGVGEGGFIATGNEELYFHCRAMADVGRLPGRPHSEHALLGGNYLMPAFEAAALSLLLKKVDSQADIRERNSALLGEAFREIPGVTLFTRPAQATRINYHFFGILFPENSAGARDRIIEGLRSRGIPCGAAYPCPVFEQPALRQRLEGPPDPSPNARRLCKDAMGFEQGLLLKEPGAMREAVRIIKEQFVP